MHKKKQSRINYVMNLSDLSSTQISCLALAIADILTKDANIKDLDILLHLLLLLRDNVSLRIHILKNKEKKD